MRGAHLLYGCCYSDLTAFCYLLSFDRSSSMRSSVSLDRTVMNQEAKRFFSIFNIVIGAFAFQMIAHFIGLPHTVRRGCATVAQSPLSTTLNTTYGEFKTSTVLTKNLVPTCRP